MSFPKRNSSNLKGSTGQTFFQHFVNNELQCIYHAISQENDFGIDGYIELVENESVSGKLIAVQLKHGNSYFKTETSGGYKFIGKSKHLNYYLNSQSPVFIVIMDEDFKRMFWVEFNVAKTLPMGGNRWWIEVPRENEITKNFKEKIFQIAGPIVDFEEQIEMNWTIDGILHGSKFRTIAIPKSEIDTGSYEYIITFIDRLSKNKDMLLNSRSTLDIFFPGCDNDAREVFQIPEVMSWLRESIMIGIPWFYFLDYNNKSVGLHLLVCSFCKQDTSVKRDKGYLIEFDSNDLEKCFEQNFINMNIFMEKNNLDIEVNKEISAGILRYFDNYLL